MAPVIAAPPTPPPAATSSFATGDDGGGSFGSWGGDGRVRLAGEVMWGFTFLCVMYPNVAGWLLHRKDRRRPVASRRVLEVGIDRRLPRFLSDQPSAITS